MISSNSSKYKNLNNKIVFGRLLETALNSLLVDEEKSTMVSNFVDDHAKDLIKNNERYKQIFNQELNALRDLIRDNAEQKNQDFNTQNEKKEQQKRLGAGGILDPIEVIKSLPMVLLECLKSRDVEQLQDVLSKMTQEEADQHLDRCIKSGLLMVNTKNAEGDGEEETKNYEETGTQDIEK
ncbi:unnamed protein product [Rotaria sp. Silwood2]|nr:unnamed protein product [Rotaria sp. Silwood2]CAF2969488.1 unnamed protein product [Rotaria sp. Silwood2]CAF3073036.1 unnamed protein product [Rotaria sp. Silwood2]CAF4071313.1 unnamed protein product [Rotaria sp. Silwood2]CAF4220944.1 unnamed protein product [Rotaria sp. Silwood2]